MKFKKILTSLLLAGTAWAAETAPAFLAEPTDAELVRMGIGDVRRAVLAESPASRWETAMLSGNGLSGAMVFGGVREETIVLNRAGLFLPFTGPVTPPSQGAHLAQIRALFAEGRYQEAADFLYELSQKEGFNGTHWTDPFVPVCSLRVRLPGDSEVTGYLRGTDYATGVAGVQWTDAAGTLVRRVFVSRADDVVVVSLQRENGAPIDCDLKLVQHNPELFEKEKSAPAEAFKLVESAATKDGLVFHSSFAKAWQGSPQGCETAARVVAPGGTVRAEDDQLRVRGAREVLILLRSAVVSKEALREPARLADSLKSLEPDYATLLARHTKLHTPIFKRMQLELGGAEAAELRLPAAKLFARSAIGKLSPALVQKQFDACRYLILSSSGDQFPPTLQGVWGATWHPAWSGDYTHDGNVPVAILGDLPANMPELLEGFFTYHESLLGAYRDNARVLFNARGIVVPARTGSHGYANHFGPRWCLTFWTAGGAWVAQTYYDYFLYTGDRRFLRQRAIPFMREVALFYEDFLHGTEGPDGRVVFTPSYSPENAPSNTQSQASVNATMDVAAAHELLSNLIAACKLEGVDSESVARWEKLLAKLPDYRINADGALAEWATPKLADNYEHRHVSHLYELYTGLSDRVAADPALMQAFKVALRKRTDWRRKIGGGEMAFGQAQMGAVAASLRLPELAYENVEMLCNWFWFPESMMTAHNPQSIFNTDIAGGIPQLIIKMLADSQVGWVELLPALPVQWPSGRIQGLLCRGGIELKSLEWSPKSVKAVFVSRADQTLRVRTAGVSGERILELKAGEAQTLEWGR